MSNEALKKRMMGNTHGKRKLTEADVREIRLLRDAGHSCKLIAANFGLHESAVYKITTRQLWKGVK